MTPAAYNQNVQIFQTSQHVVLLNEMIHNARVVPMDGRPHGRLRQWIGDSRGRWEGDTLVVDTTNFLRETAFLNGKTSPNLHLVERFTRVDADTLLYEFTVEDPTVWTRPWTAQIAMSKSDQGLYEYRLPRRQPRSGRHPGRRAGQGERERTGSGRVEVKLAAGGPAPPARTARRNGRDLQSGGAWTGNRRSSR